MRASIALWLTFAATSFGAPAAADEGAVREAAKHFQRGVALYGEADYRAALVEFKRAYALSPNTAVLYNVGETDYQLKDYTAALTTFERCLAEAGPGDAHRGELETDLEALRARVGHLAVVTIPPGADVTLDDQTVGRTPLDKPLLVSVGRRKVVATIAGRAPVTRYVDVATDDDVAVTLPMPDATPSPVAPPRRAPDLLDSPAAPSPGAGPALRLAGWITAGTLAAGAVTTGVLAERASSTLQSDRNSYPMTSATLEQDAHATTTYAILTDALAAGAALVGGLTLVSALTAASDAPGRARVRAVLGPGAARLEGTF